MGIVYEAEQPMGEGMRRVAIKTLLPELSRDPVVVSRFNRECSVVAGLEHPNTVRVYDFGTTEDGSLYIAMEYVAGRPLGEVIAEGPMPVERCLGIMEQIASALEEAHDQGIVHRDLKPDNIVLSDRAGLRDFVKVLDFGIAKRSSSGGKHDTNLTQQGMILGTPPYMSPEQFTGEPLDRTSDVYSLGIILYEMINSKLPFEGDTPWQWAHQHMSVEPAPFLAPVSHGIQAVVRLALSKAKGDRPASALEFYRRLCGAASVHPRSLSRSGNADAAMRRTDPGASARPVRTEPSMLQSPSADPRTLDESTDASAVAGTTAPGAPSLPQSQLAGTGTDPVALPVRDRSADGSRFSGHAYVPIPAPVAGRRAVRRRGTFWALLLMGATVAGVALASTWWLLPIGNQSEEPPRPTLVDAGSLATGVAAEPHQIRDETSVPMLVPTWTPTPPRRPAQNPARSPSQAPAAVTGAATTTATTPSSAPPSSSSTPFPLPFPITVPSILTPSLPPFTLPLPGMASTAVPQSTLPQQPPTGMQRCTQAGVLANSDIDAAVSEYQACESAVGRAASMPARAKIAAVGIARATTLARQGRCDEANRVIQALARIGVHRNAQIAVTNAGC